MPCSGTRKLHLQGDQDVFVNVTMGIKGSPKLQLVLARTAMIFAISREFSATTLEFTLRILFFTPEQPRNVWIFGKVFPLFLSIHM